MKIHPSLAQEEAPFVTDAEAKQLFDQIMALYPDPQPTLHAEDPFQILVAVMLSAQTTDVAVNAVTPKLFAAYPTPADMAAAPIEAIAAIISRLGLYRTKAAHLKALSDILVKEYAGKVPNKAADLVRLPGVGKKTATVVLSDAFNIPGVAVDTHVSRIVKGLGLVPQNATPVQIQARLEALMPPSEWIKLHRSLIRFGREYLRARDPQVPAGTQWAFLETHYLPLGGKS
ncbi:endoIII-like endonuclease [Lacticaseibacillus paracasei subsp. tolerans DSM 20258]|nr:endoIII-like endonuclease [Lacticaseibacillus paracasei subsp. tolerans DSM 20258]